MEKTDTFFIISNYNTDPEQYLHYCKDYHIYDQSPDIEIRQKLKNKYTEISFVENTGHNISDYFRFFIDNYKSLPQHMMLAKGNMIGRHVTQEYFDRVYNNKCYTSLYDDRGWLDKRGVAYQLYDGSFLEINNSWYASTKPHKYFATYNELLTFIFRNPIIPQWVLFSPGACYIVSREQVLKYPKEFYENLKTLVSYTYFPTEAYHVERMMNVIFSANYEINSYMKNTLAFQEELKKNERLKLVTEQRSKTVNRMWKHLYCSLSARYNSFLYRMMLGKQ
jgi:hypothetical protein